MRLIHRSENRQHGQILPLFAVLLPILIIFIGLAIDLGFAYLTKATLSKAVDAACLSGVRNLPLGRAQSEVIAKSAFALNYGVPGRETTAPVPVVAFSLDGDGNTLVNVDATTTINTFFIRILPQWKTLDVSAHAQATRAPLVMSLIADRSGSMTGNGGGVALKVALPNFVDDFDDIEDRVALISFASTETAEAPMKQAPGNFKSTIKSKTSALKFDGGTFGPGALTDAVGPE